MQSAAQTEQPAPSRWHNHLPEWIVDDPAFIELRPMVQRTLQAIANRCDAHKDGFIGAFGGSSLQVEIGISRATFWRYLNALERLGFVVTLARGGTFNGKNYGNQYGIPTSRGSLDHRRCQREVRVMRRGEDGKLRPQVITAGSQLRLWHPDPVSQRDGGSLTVRRGLSHGETPPYPCEYPCDSGGVASAVNGGGVSAGSRKRRRRPAYRLSRVVEGDLRSSCRLMTLFDRACDRGLIGRSDHDRLLFFAAAVHARRVGKDNPPGLFAAIVNRGMWLNISQQDQLEANEWLKRHLYGE